jgi:hypothetical protein
MKAPRVSVSIDRLVLRGWRSREGDAIIAAFRAELARLLAEPATLHDSPPVHLAAAPRRTLRGAVPSAFGAEAASHVAASAGARPSRGTAR